MKSHFALVTTTWLPVIHAWLQLKLVYFYNDKLISHDFKTHYSFIKN